MTGHNHGESIGLGASRPDGEETGQPIIIPKKAKEPLKPVYSAYFEFQNALATDNFDAAKTAGVSMRNAIEQVNMNRFPEEAHKPWIAYSSDLKNALQHIGHAGDLEGARKIFQQISTPIIVLTQGFDNPLGREIYVQFCPMADNNNGASWLSLNQEIQNPFFGSEMHNCGEITTAIP